MTQPEAPANPMFDPAAIGQRVTYLAHAVVGHFSRVDRNHPAIRFDTRSIGKMQDVANAWHGAEALTKDEFRQRFFDPMTSDATVEQLRAAIKRAATAKTYADLGAASKGLAIAMGTIGLDRWPGFLTKMSSRAAAATSKSAQ